MEEKLLFNKENRGIIQVTDGWVRCPVCQRNKKLLRITPKTVAKHLPVYCRLCGSEIILDIEGLSARRLSQ